MDGYDKIYKSFDPKMRSGFKTANVTQTPCSFNERTNERTQKSSYKQLILKDFKSLTLAAFRSWNAKFLALKYVRNHLPHQQRRSQAYLQLQIHE